MIRNSFIFLPRVGDKTEHGLWQRGILEWDDYVRGPVEGIGEGTHALHMNLIEHAARALKEQQVWRLGEMFPHREHWRLFKDLAGRALFLDIETTGYGRWPDITVVGIAERDGVRTFIQGENLTRQAISDRLSRASMIVTFNGSLFDLPLLKQKGVKLPRVPHLDLRWAAARAGLKGGLKKVEIALGLDRGDELAGLSGYDAVLLWRRWKERQDTGALDLLIKYNKADILSLRPIAEEVYARLRNAGFERFSRHP